MNKDLEQMWQDVFDTPGKVVNIGRIVVCDFCSDDYTESPVSGGLIFGSYAICPKCCQKITESRRIRARCPPWVSFADFVREYRGPNCRISIQPIEGPR